MTGYGLGWQENTFDEFQYVASHADLINAFGSGNGAAATQHYVEYGFDEGRMLDFNAQQYLDNYAVLQAAFGSDLMAATIHYIDYGFYEDRTDEII